MIHDEIAEVLKRRVVLPGAAPGASACVAAFRSGVWRFAEAAAGRRSSAAATLVDSDTLYDLASLTKPVLACSLARVVRAGALGWDTPLGEALPLVAGSQSAATPLELLLAHRAGLEAHIRLRDTGLPRTAWLARCADARRSDCVGSVPAQGFEPVYSDLGYILLGATLEARLGLPLDAVFEREVFAPLELELGSARQWAARLGREAFRSRVAPTELLAERGGELAGEVHDDNAWDLAGSGSAGHAGLFGTARGVAALGTAVLDVLTMSRAAWLTPEEVAPVLIERQGGSLLAGFDGKAELGSSAGLRFGPHAFGHLGFTGTSLWCDPDAKIAVVLLTNRVHPTRENILIRSVRPDVHGDLFGLAADLLA